MSKRIQNTQEIKRTLFKWTKQDKNYPYVLFRPIKKRSFNLLCVLDLFSERLQSTLFQIFFSSEMVLVRGKQFENKVQRLVTVNCFTAAVLVSLAVKSTLISTYQEQNGESDTCQLLSCSVLPQRLCQHFLTPIS